MTQFRCSPGVAWLPGILVLVGLLSASCSEDESTDPTSSGGTAGSAAGGSAGASTGGSAGAATGGSGGVAHGGSGGSTGGSATGGSAGTGTGGSSSCIDAFKATPSFEDNFDAGWEDSQTAWRRASWEQNGTQMAPDRCVTNDQGMLEQTVLAGSPYRGGSMQSTSEYLYGRWLARLKPSNVPGVLNSMFTMDWDDMTTPGTDGDGTHQEIDIEFLTYTFGQGNGQVHFAVHDRDHSNYVSEDISLGFDPSQDFHEWSIDILPDRIDWRVDGNILHTFAYDGTVSITGNYEMFFNSWTGTNWVNGPPTSDAVYQIDWVRFHPYDPSCSP